MKILKFIFLLLPVFSAFSQTDFLGRRYQFFEDMDVFPESQRVEFYQRESVRLDITVFRDNAPVDFSSGDKYSVWEAVTTTNPYTAYIVSTAAVINATGGVIRFSLSPEEAMVPEGDFDGFIRLYEKNLNEIVDMGVIQRQNVRVRRSPPSEGVNFVGPLWWDRYDPNQLIIDDLVVNTFETLSFTMGGETIFSLPKSDVYEMKHHTAEYNSSPKYTILNNGTGLVFTIKPLAALDGISIVESNGAVVITGNATQSVYQFFPQQSHNRGRIYVRQGTSPYQISALDVPQGAVTPALSSDGTNIFWSSGVPVPDSPLFDGKPPSYYENFQLMTNIPIYNASSFAPFIGDDIDGFEAGDNVSFSIVSKADPVTPTQSISVLRLDVAGSLGTNVDAILTRENTWSKLNKFNGGIEVKNKIIMTGIARNSGLHSSVGIGGSNISAQAAFSTVVGGRDSTASGIDSIAGGRGANAQGANSLALMQGSLAGAGNAVAIGFGNLARGGSSLAIGGANNDVLDNGYAIGGQYNELRGANNWSFANRSFSDKPYVYMFGDGAQNYPIRAERERSLVVMANASNAEERVYFVGINTNSPLYTNVVLEARGGPSVFESIIFPDGSTITNGNFVSGSGSGNASLTSSWSVLYSDGQTNSISLPLGVSNSVLVSMGPDQPPKFITDGFGGGTITSVTADVNHFVVTGSAGPAVNVSLNSTAATNLWKAEQAYGWGDHGTEGYLTTESDPVFSTYSSGINNVSGRVVTLEGYLPGIANVSGRVVTLEGYTPGIANVSGRVVAIEAWTTDNLSEGTSNKYADDWSEYSAKQNVNLAGYSLTNALEVGFYTNNTVNPEEGLMRWNEDFETVVLGLHGDYKLPIGEASVFPVINQSGNDIAKGTLVAAAGTLGNSGKILIQKAFESGSTMPSSRIMGVLPEQIDNGDAGYVVHFGRIRGLNMTNYAEGAFLYADPDNPGGFTTNIPLAPKSKTLVALVINNTENQGAIWVRTTFGSSLANNELVNIGNLSDGDVLVYDSGGAFTNKALGSLAFTNVSFVPSPDVVEFSGSVTAATFSVLLADTSASDSYVYLPPANASTGAVVSARKMNPENFLYMVAPDGHYVQGVSTVGLTVAGNVIEVFSDGKTNWWLK